MKPVSGGVLNGTAITLPSPAYPDGAKRMKVQGVVTVEVVLDETGKVISAASYIRSDDAARGRNPGRKTSSILTHKTLRNACEGIGSYQLQVLS